MSSNDASVKPRLLRGELASFDNDCACPIPPTAASPPVVPDGLYRAVPEVYHDTVSEGWRLYCNALGGGAPVLLNDAACQRLASFTTPQPLCDELDQQLASAGLVAPLGAPAPLPTAQSDTLTAWLHVTNACNLDCPYCYVRKSGAKMSFEMGVRSIDALITTAQQRGFTTIKLKYAGGEAALHYRLVQRLHEYATEQAAQHGLLLKAVVLSNGTVMPPLFAAWLASSGVRLMLSVDGVGEAHDVQRPWKGRGPGAFAALERHLVEQLLPRGIKPDICITVTGRTAASARSAVEWAMRFDLPFSLNFYRENEQSAPFHDLRFQEQQIIAGMLDAYQAVEQTIPVRPFLDGLLDRVQSSAHSHTCGVGYNYAVITHEGHVAQCQMELQHAQPFDSHTDLIRLVGSGPIHNVAVDTKQGCRDCQWRYRCAGGCPIVTLRATGRTDVKSPNCNIYRTLIPAALRLEGLRILKVHDQPTM